MTHQSQEDHFVHGNAVPNTMRLNEGSLGPDVLRRIRLG